MEMFLNYSYYDEYGKFVAIVDENTPEHILKDFKEKYDEVKFKE